jgi:archaellum component FlaC
MALTVTKEELDRLRKRYKELGSVIDELTDTLGRASSATERVLEPELIKARKELASVVERLKSLSGESSS